MGAISGAISAGVGASGVFGNIGSPFLKGALTAATSSALSQGIGVATGLQKKFDFAGVAGAAIGGGVGGALGARSLAGNMSFGNIMANVAATSAGALANAGARTLINGSDFGDNLMAALPDIIGSTIGNLISGSLTHREGLTPRTLARSLADEVTFESGLTREGRARVQDLRESLEARAENGPAATPEERMAQAVELDRRVEAVLRLARTPAEQARVADYRQSLFGARSVPPIGDIDVTGNYDKVEYWASRHIDNAGIWIGEQKEALSQNFNRFLDDHPGARIGFNVASMGLTIAGGPVRYGASVALNYFEDEVTGLVSNGYSGAGWEGADPAHGGQGIVFGAKILLGGARSHYRQRPRNRSEVWQRLANLVLHIELDLSSQRIQTLARSPVRVSGIRQ